VQLRDFITETLVQIAQGIERANERLEGSSALVNPKNVKTYTRGENLVMRLSEDKEHDRFADFIEFDVAAYAKEDAATKGTLGIVIGTIGLGTQGQSANSIGSESRIRFRIPMVMPTAG